MITAFATCNYAGTAGELNIDGFGLDAPDSLWIAPQIDTIKI